MSGKSNQRRATQATPSPRGWRSRERLLLLPLVALALFLGVQNGWARLVAAPGPDGLPPDPEIEAAVDDLNQHILTAADAVDKDVWLAQLDSILERINPPQGQCLHLQPPAPYSDSDCAIAEDSSACEPYPCTYAEPDGCNLSEVPYDDVSRSDLVIRVKDGLTLERNTERSSSAWRGRS